MKTETLAAALREFRLALEQGKLQSDTLMHVDDGAQVHHFDLRSVLLLAAEALDRPDMRYVPVFRRLVKRMQEQHYDLLYERLMGEQIPEELQEP